LNKVTGFATELFPIGALSKESAEKIWLTMLDMKKKGAIAFGDHNKTVIQCKCSVICTGF
jgi:dihydroorotase